MADTSYFFSTRPAYPWSEYPAGLPALAVVAAALVALTVWTYLGHPQATGRRLGVVLGLRLLALLVALLTAVRPSVGVQEEPKVPSTLLVGVDLSESMTVADEFNSQTRVDAVRKTLERCRQTLDELKAEQNVNVVIYKFGPPDFSEPAGRYDEKAPADAKRSDYGAYLNRTFERWQGERFLRGHVLIGDGVDNGVAFSAVAEAARWRPIGCPIHTFAVGSENTPSQGRDVAVTAVNADPSVPIKNDLTVKAVVNAYGFQGARVKARLLVGDDEAAVEEVTLAKEKDNEVTFRVKAPPTPGEYRLRVELPTLPGELSAENNAAETYLTVTKEGVRVLIVDRLRWERTMLIDALRPEVVEVDGKKTEKKRFDVVQVARQTDLPPSPGEAEALDLDAQGYDVMILGNVTARQLTTVNPKLLEQIADRVRTKGMGLMMVGGEAAFGGSPDAPGTGDWRGTPIADLLPVTFDAGGIVEIAKNPKPPLQRSGPGFQTVPTAEGLGQFLMRLGGSPTESESLWDQLNLRSNRSRLTGYNRLVRKPTATLYAWASGADAVERVVPTAAVAGDPLLVGHQVGDGSRGRVLAFAGFDTYLWQALGARQPGRQGVELHNRFWKQCVLWLAHQEEDEGQVYVRPQFRRQAAGTDQTVRVGVKKPNGTDDPDSEPRVRVLAPGEYDAKALAGPNLQAALADRNSPAGKALAEALAKSTPRTLVRDAGGAKVVFKPSAAGEYIVIGSAPAKDKDGKPVTGPDGLPAEVSGAARFLVHPDVSDEMLRTAADHGYLKKLTAAAGEPGKALRLEDLPGFLKELKAQPQTAVKPRPKFYPDWQRRKDHGNPFLPLWLVLFTGLLGAEWALRRVWGMI